MRVNRVVILLIIFILSLSVLLNIEPSKSVSARIQPVPDIPDQPATNHFVYLPMIFGQGGVETPQNFGVEPNYIDETQMNKADEVNTYWMRYAAINWAAIQPNAPNPTPVYDWSKVNNWALREASARGMQMIATIKYTPSWAQLYSGVSCGPIKPDRLDEFAQFMQALVSTYGVHPYNIKYWEIGNEVDVDPDLLGDKNSFYGCWGDDSEYYYGGEYYADMLKVVYLAVKEVDPDAKILIGGLLLACDSYYNNYPTNIDCRSEAKKRPGRFFEGILINGGGAYFDIVSFHGYSNYFGNLLYDENDAWWSHRGGWVLGKADFLREVMGWYNVDKPLLHSEASLNCPGCSVPPSSAFLDAQADYVIWAHVRNMAADIMGTIWYTLTGPGWRQGGLLDGSQSPRPSFYSFQFMAQEMHDANFIIKTNEYPACPQLRAYKFSKGTKQIWVMWTGDESTCSITPPVGTQVIYDKFGAVVTPVSGQISIKSPVYVELIP